MNTKKFVLHYEYVNLKWYFGNVQTQIRINKRAFFLSNEVSLPIKFNYLYFSILSINYFYLRVNEHITHTDVSSYIFWALTYLSWCCSSSSRVSTVVGGGSLGKKFSQWIELVKDFANLATLLCEVKKLIYSLTRTKIWQIFKNMLHYIFISWQSILRYVSQVLSIVCVQIWSHSRFCFY